MVSVTVRSFWLLAMYYDIVMSGPLEVLPTSLSLSYSVHILQLLPTETETQLICVIDDLRQDAFSRTPLFVWQ